MRDSVVTLCVRERACVCEYLFRNYFLSVCCVGGPAMHIVEMSEPYTQGITNPAGNSNQQPFNAVWYVV